MSVTATNWAYEQRLPQSVKAVLLALAHRHNSKTGACNPSVETLAIMAGASERSVQRALKQLQKERYIAPIGSTKGGRAKSIKWRLLIVKGCQVVTLSDGVKGDNATGFRKTRKGDCVSPDREVSTIGGKRVTETGTFFSAAKPSHNLRVVAGGAPC